MSIIYDALKKTQEVINLSTRPRKQEPPKQVLAENRDIQSKSRPKTRLYFSYVLVACLGLFIANIFFGRSKPFPKDGPKVPRQEQAKLNLPQQPSIPELPALPKTAPPQQGQSSLPFPSESKKENYASLILNGIFFSENEGYALINNQIVKAGDEIEGAVVKRIDLNEVELERAGSVFKLSTRSR